jgi:hypothetical protein
MATAGWVLSRQTQPTAAQALSLVAGFWGQCCVCQPITGGCNESSTDRKRLLLCASLYFSQTTEKVSGRLLCLINTDIAWRWIMKRIREMQRAQCTPHPKGKPIQPQSHGPFVNPLTEACAPKWRDSIAWQCNYIHSVIHTSTKTQELGDCPRPNSASAANWEMFTKWLRRSRDLLLLCQQPCAGLMPFGCRVYGPITRA